MHVGLFPPERILSASTLNVLALLPTYAEPPHPLCTDEQHAINRHVLTWKSLGLVLEKFFELDATETTADSFLYVGELPFGTDAELRSVFAVPLLWLAGTL